MPRLSDGVAAPKMPRQPTGNGRISEVIGPVPGSKVSYGYDLPMNTPIPDSSNYGAPQGYNPAPNPYAYAPQQQAQQFGGGGGSSIASAPAPEPQAKPVMTEADWLAGDSQYQDQMTEYDNTLKDFLARLATQESDFDTDFGVAQKGFARNKEQGLLGLGEDFTSRGLANSGMFVNAQNESKARYQDQENGLNTSRTRAKADFGNQRTDKQKATDQAKGNAKKDSLGRMSMDQAF